MAKQHETESSPAEATPETIEPTAEAPIEAEQPTEPEAAAESPADEALAAAKAEADEYRDRWMRAVAELENFRRRTAREQMEQISRAGERILLQLLEPVDNLERAIKAAKGENGGNGDANAQAGMLQGIEMIYNQCLALLEREGAKPMESVGKPFDAQLHDALMMVENAEYPPNTIISEAERGWFLGEKVLRHAKVVVSKAPVEKTTESQPDNADN